MFNIGFTEMILIGVLALIFVGPKQLPELAKIIARALNDLKRATGDVTDSFSKMTDDVRRDMLAELEKPPVAKIQQHAHTHHSELEQKTSTSTDLKSAEEKAIGKSDHES